MTGDVPTPTGTHTVVPAGATAVVLNVTAVQPSNDGFVSVRPDGTPGPPATSNLNVTAGTVVPNAVTVALPADGPDSGAIDIVDDAYGLAGDGSNGAFDNVQAAIDSISGASSVNRYVVRIGPGTFHGKVEMTPDVSLVGSGKNSTTLTSNGGTALPSESGESATINIEGAPRVEIRQLGVSSTQGDVTTAIRVVSGSVQITDVTANVSSLSSDSRNTAIYTSSQSLEMRDVVLISSGGTALSTVGLEVRGGRLTLLNAQIQVGSASGTNRGVSVSDDADARLVNITTQNVLLMNPLTAIHVQAARATVWDSRIIGDTAMSWSSDMSGNVPSIGVASSQIVGTVPVGPCNCVGAFDEDFGELTESCQ